MTLRTQLLSWLWLVTSAVLVVAAVWLFLYPAWTVVNVLTDSGMANGGVPRVVVSRFGSLSGRYDQWGVGISHPGMPQAFII